MLRFLPKQAARGRRPPPQRVDFDSKDSPSDEAVEPVSIMANTTAAAEPPRAPTTVASADFRRIGIEANAAPTVATTLPGLPWNIALGDWDDLLSAVKAGDVAVGDCDELMQSVNTGDVAIGDWDDLLNAVKTRLRLSVGEPIEGKSTPRSDETPDRVRSSVLECVAALDHLHTTLTHELGRCRQLKMEVLSAQAALAQARTELAGTRAGERRARHLALHDGLTSLPNRRFFRERLDVALTNAEPLRPALALLYLDLDGFKPINDAHGHDAGDELLKIVAARLSRVVRAGDMVSRLGGDEFACLLADSVDRQHLSHLASKVFDAVSAPLKIGKLKLTVRPSIGIAICPTDGDTAEALLKSADAAMYRAKRHQSGYAFFDRHTDT